MGRRKKVEASVGVHKTKGSDEGKKWKMRKKEPEKCLVDNDEQDDYFVCAEGRHSTFVFRSEISIFVRWLITPGQNFGRLTNTPEMIMLS
jgi:hypothetical protein